MVVRGSEYDLPPDVLDDIVAQSISSFGGQAQDRRRRPGRRQDNESGDEYEGDM